MTTSSMITTENTSPQTAPHLSAYRSFNASMFLSYSLRSAISCAVSSPNTSAIHANVTSIPALIPELVQMLPSATQRALATQSTSGCLALTYCIASAVSKKVKSIKRRGEMQSIRQRETYIVKRPLVRRRSPPIQHPRPSQNLTPRTNRKHPLDPAILSYIQTRQPLHALFQNAHVAILPTAQSSRNQQHIEVFGCRFKRMCWHNRLTECATDVGLGNDLSRDGGQG